jgi:hypothetical protein
MGNKLLFLSLVLINSLFVGVLYVTFDDLPGNLSDIRSRHLRHAGIYPYVSSSSDIGVGMGSGGTLRQALTEALEEAGKSSRLRNPAFAILSFSQDHDLGSFLKTARSALGAETQIFGWASLADGIITNQGYERQDRTGGSDSRQLVSAMLFHSENIAFGVGAASFSDFDTVEQAAQAAIRQSMKNAGRTGSEKPQAVIIAPGFGHEEKVIHGIEEIIGRETPILGGSTYASICGTADRDTLVTEGVTVATMYTSLPVGWIFEGGVDAITTQGGEITRVEGMKILEIDHRPAAEVYDEWNDYQVRPMAANELLNDQLREHIILNPLCQKFFTPSGQAYVLFFSLLPDFTEGSLKVGVNLKEGDRVYLGHSSWEAQMNQIVNLPYHARLQQQVSAERQIKFGFGYLCAGVLKIIPDTEKEKIPRLLHHANDAAPFLIGTSSGEQGNFPGIGNRHGHLLASYLVVGSKE